MKLSEAKQNDVVRNMANESFYRYERTAEDGSGRSRIRPLEIFPNRRLIAKPTDTIVQSDIEVELVGPWHDDMVVSKGRGKSRQTYEKERDRLVTHLVELQEEALVILPRQRGSHANRVKAVESRLTSLDRGLENLGTEEATPTTSMAIPTSEFVCKQIVTLPSGAPAQFLGLLPVKSSLLATVMAKFGKVTVVLQIDPAALRPWERRHMATV